MLNNQTYQLEFPPWFCAMNLPINAIETLNCLFALRRFFDDVRGCDVILRTDNTCARDSLNHLKAGTEPLRSVAREVIMLIHAADAKLTVEHVDGSSLTSTADALSRGHLGSPFSDRVQLLVESGDSVETLDIKHWRPPLNL